VFGNQVTLGLAELPPPPPPSHTRPQFTFQYTLWDQFSQLANLSPRQILHLAKLVVFLLADHALSLAILKVTSFIFIWGVLNT
jgi:hypothetical protein